MSLMVTQVRCNWIVTGEKNRKYEEEAEAS